MATKAKKRNSGPGRGVRTVIWIVTLVTLSLFLCIALASYRAAGGMQWAGPVGTLLASLLAGGFGLLAWLVPLEMLLLANRLRVAWRDEKNASRSADNNALGSADNTVATLSSIFVIVVCATTLTYLLTPDFTVFGGHAASGAIGRVLGEVLTSLFGKVGSALLLTATLIATWIVRSPRSLAVCVTWLKRSLLWLKTTALELIVTVREAWQYAKTLENTSTSLTGPSLVGAHISSVGGIAAPQPHELERSSAGGVSASARAAQADVAEPAELKNLSSTVPQRRLGLDKAPTIVRPKDTILKESSPNQKKRNNSFNLPPTDLLEQPPPTVLKIDEEALRLNAELVVEKLASYGVHGNIDEIHPGPVVTMYEFEPQSGTKVSKIAGLENDLALALAAPKVRIVAPIPGKARVGIELPNADRQTVYLREILEDRRWNSHKGNLPIALGKDIGGKPVYADLTKMPHLLVAGATGAGKSVGLNVMLASLLAKKTPDEVRLLMIDPKVVELAVFDGIPHMLLPVVTDMNKAALALKWTVDEMERRYQLFAEAGARNITSYNAKIEKYRAGDLALEKLGHAATEAGDAKKLPFVVLVVDEFADLMMVAAKDVEACIARLAQKARAAGIHVIIATQRPSVDVITGMIKANFPARIGFKVSQREDSKTILGRNGAENLLGRGDMLMLPPGSSDLLRVHSAYISEEDVGILCNFLREQGEPEYDESILQPREDDEPSLSSADGSLYDRAVAVVAQAGYCSISHVQRKLSIGYNRAANLVDEMEKQGVVGPATKKAGGRREVFVSP